ncbi:2-hydroxychromene-2-carboxylate isomerase [Erythrobacter sanguineus]|uniref:2-hydroxychromene-2-carboxylate isomerase n=1 Tax=Erythrobacter sanguineus TaxID=198312 RepID=A0A1M7S0W8_9SPHN|nr:2-hydroxychromene-2-carboxylate isomerase [Erythrobacter sanguineus]SHN52237.1 2-hydroxychromene-2-carboxylate isomerase [Erythrobacter sanguineus]
MTKRIELVFDFVSPNAYLIWWPLREIAARHGAEIDVVPVFLAGMHKLTGNAPPMIRDGEVKGKNAYAQLEMDRFIAKHGLTKYRLHPHFPFNSITLQRMLAAACEDGRGADFVEALLAPIWEDGLDVFDPQAIGAVLGAAGFDAADLYARAQTDAVKQALAANTDAVVERGAFGIPTMWVGDAMFFGKERLGQIEELLDEG